VTSPPGDRLRLLYELGCAFTARTELDELIPLVITKCRDALDAEGGSVLLLDAGTNEFVIPYVAEQNAQAAERLVGLRVPVEGSIAGAVVREGRPIRVDDAHTDPRSFAGADRQTGIRTGSLLAAPLRSRHGTIGVIEVVNRRGGGAFTDDDLAFLEALAGSVAVAIENARLYAQLKQQLVALQEGTRDREQLLAIRRELDIARGIQQSFLPRIFPRRPDFDIFAQMIPAREVGGDFYDFFLVDDTRLGVVVGDVSGKGIPAALFMAVSRCLLKSVALAGTPPAECLRRVNALLCLDNSAELFVTVFYGVLDTRTGELEYSNGGHNPPYVVRGAGDVHPLEGTGGIVLGVFDDIHYRAKRAALRPGDGVFLYTDGVTEAMDAEGNLFSDPRLQALLAQHGHASSEAITRAVVDEVRRYSASVPQSDDITTMAIRYRG